MERCSTGCIGVVREVAHLFQKSATLSGCSPNTSPHCLPNSHLWLQVVGCAHQRPDPGTLRWHPGKTR